MEKNYIDPIKKPRQHWESRLPPLLTSHHEIYPIISV
jgi:hypothetical protein